MDRFDQLGTVAACILRADDEILGTITPSGPSEQRHGFQVMRASHVLEVASTEAGRVTVRYPFSVSGQLAQRLSLDEANDLLTEQEQSQLGPEEARQYAARKRVAAIESEQQDEAVRAGLESIEPVESRTNTVTTTVDDQQCWDGIAIYDYCYPGDDAFGPTAYDDVVTQVVTEGHGCAKGVMQSLPLFDEDVEIDQ